MDDVTRHPADDRLHDFVAGTLDADASALVERHLARCAACAGFVRAARAGEAALVDVVEPMPDELSTNLHAALAGAWRERRDAIAADERARDAVAPPVAAPAADGPATAPGSAPARPARASRWRRAVPVLAFVVLATLAGTSVYLGGDEASVDEARSGAESETAATAQDSPVDLATDGAGPTAGAVERELAAPDAAAEQADASGALEDAARSAKSTGAEEFGTTDDDGADGAGAGSDAAFDTPPVAEPGESIEPVYVTCIVTRDATSLTLPDGRIASTITPGPFGLYLVCG